METEVLAFLRASLSLEEGVRTRAEAQLKQLFLHPDGGLILARLLLSPQVEVAQRQISYSAGILLQQYIQKHWSFLSLEYTEPPTTVEVKQQIRPILFQGLSDPERKIRSAAAFAISSIARYDWPDEWPDLLYGLVQLLRSPKTEPVHGAMRVVSEFVKNDLSEDQLLPVVRDLVPALLNIFQNTNQHSATTRASTVAVLREVIKMLETVKIEHAQAVKEALKELCPTWLSAFKVFLQRDVVEEVRKAWESLGIYDEIFRTLLLLHQSFPKSLSSEIPTFIQAGIHTLSSILPMFQTFYILSDEDAPDLPSPVVSEFGQPDKSFGIDDMAMSAFEFLSPVVRAKVAESLIINERDTTVLETMISQVVEYTQINRVDEEDWIEDPNIFVEDEDEEAVGYNIRVIGHDLIGSLIDKWPETTARTMERVVRANIRKSSDLRSQNQAHWWKPLEAALAMAGGVADDIRPLAKDEAAFNLQYLFEQIIPDLLGLKDTPFLLGRALVFSGQFASLLPEAQAERYLSAAVMAMSSDNGVINISAVKAIKNFCRFVDRKIIFPQAEQILSTLVPLLHRLQGEVLDLMLETTRAVITINECSFSESAMINIMEEIFRVWLENIENPVICAEVDDLVEAIAPYPIISPLARHFASKLGAVILAPVTEVTLSSPDEGVQLANCFLKRNGPIETEFMACVTAAVFIVLRSTDDMDLIQHGMIHLTLLVRKDCDRLIEWHNGEGSNGIAIIFELLGQFLAPTFSESGGIFVGELVMHLFRKAGQGISPVLPDLLRAIAARLTTAKLPSFIQSLVIPFAYLFSTEYTQSTIDLLSQISLDTEEGQKSALQVVLSAWCDVNDTLTGSWNIRVGDLGMCKLFLSADARLRSVAVKGDLIITEKNKDTIMTRSRTKLVPTEYTTVPFPLKALKLILKDVTAVGKPSGSSKPGNVDIEEDDGDDDWDDDDPLEQEVGEFEYLSSWLDGGTRDDAQDDDEDLKSDPLAQVDMAEHMTNVLRESYATNHNGIHEMVGGLNEQEKATLKAVLTL